MSQVSMQQVKELRERTQAGLNDCRSALLETEGDIEKAVEVILKKGLAKSAKRAGAVAAEGVVATSVAADGKSGVIVEVNIQTDFAARNPDFVAFVDKVVEAANGADDGADLGALPFPGGSGTIEENRQALVGRLGENITIRRWARVRAEGDGLVQSYVHMGGKIGVLLLVQTASAAVAGSAAVKKLADDTAMQIAAMAPLHLSSSEIPEDARAKQREIFEGQLREQDKAPPEQAWPKIIEGKLAKWAKEICLLEQPSVLESDKTVDAVRAAVAKEAGGDVTLVRFVRFERGEGIEASKGDDFADEVAKMARGN
jgi:elongation factor Ts